METNLYRYAFNNPINFTDPEGKLPPQFWAAIGVGAGFIAWAINWWYASTNPPESDRCKMKEDKKLDDQVPGSPGMPRNFPPYQPPPPPRAPAPAGIGR